MKKIFFFYLLIIFSISQKRRIKNFNSDSEISLSSSPIEVITCILQNKIIIDNLKLLIEDLKDGDLTNIITTFISIFPSTYEEIIKCQSTTANYENLILKSSTNQKDNRIIELEKLVTTIEDYPNKGFHFRDITGVIQTYRGFELIVDLFSYKLMPIQFDCIVALEPHGFIFASSLAYEYRKKLILARYKGRLPGEVISIEYEEQSKHKGIEILKNSIKKGDKVVVVDDFIATGITIQGACKLVEQLGGIVVKILSIIEVLSYDARNNVLKGYDIFSIIQYEG
jgi:adenine phosphoribosyltransferase